MAKKKAPEREPEKNTADYYKLKTQAVEDLVTASVENSPKVSAEELRKYRSGPKLKLSEWLKAVLLKAWFAGVVCYFMIWGAGIGNPLDIVLLVGIVLGIVTDLLTNSIFRLYARSPGQNDRWMMVSAKKYISLPLNILYSIALVFCVVVSYNAINLLLCWITRQTEPPLSIEPILFGFLTAAWDLLFLGMRRLMQGIVYDAKRQAADHR